MSDGSDTSSAVNVYDDPELYDLENEILDELPSLLALADQTGGPILDLACGTGRTTLPMADAGHEVIGVDLSEPMLARAREKAQERGLTVEFHRQDCRRLDLPLSAKLATMTGNAFQEFLTNEDQDGLLSSVARHLSSGGIFVFETRFPSAANLNRGEGEQPWNTTTDEYGRRIAISVIWSYDPRSQVQDYTFIERISERGHIVEEKRSLGCLRYTWPLEMERLLAAHGFELDEILGGWDGSRLTSDSTEMVVFARRQ